MSVVSTRFRADMKGVLVEMKMRLGEGEGWRRGRFVRVVVVAGIVVVYRREEERLRRKVGRRVGGVIQLR